MTIDEYTISSLVIHQKHRNVYQSVHNCSEEISYLFKVIRFSCVGKPILNEWTGVAVLCCYGKKVILIFIHQKWLGLAVMGKYFSKLLMLFILAFLMKCKYTYLSLEHLMYIDDIQ